MDLRKLENDMTEDEKASLADFVKKGKPGIMSIQDTDISSFFNFYTSGKTYAEIAQLTNKKKDVILYFSYKCKWFEKKIEHYQDLAENILEKVKKIKLESINTMATAVSAMGKYHEKNFNKYISSNQSSVIENMDNKGWANYCKAVDSLEKMTSEATSTNSKKPSVNVNIMGSAKVEQVDDNTLEVSSEDTGKMLKLLAELENNKKN